MRQAVQLFEQVLEKDPDYAPAYAGLADCYGLLGWVAFGALAPREAFPRAEAAARKAIELDPSLAEAHTALAWSLMAYNWDWPQAERHFRRALEVNPRYATGHSWYGLALCWAGRTEEAYRASEQAIELDPLSLAILTLAGWVFHFAGRYEDAIALYQRALELDPDYVRAHLGLGWSYDQIGATDAAIEEFRKGEARSGHGPGFVASLGHAFAGAGRRAEAQHQLELLTSAAESAYVSPSYFAEIHAGLGDAERTRTWLERAYEDRSGALVYLHVDPQFQRFRAEPWFKDLVARVGFAGVAGG
jgi:tetratricopeptide (TPR) repeat protein